jgi:hypothetical protein
MKPEQIKTKDPYWMVGKKYPMTQVWLSTMKMYVRPKVDEPVSPKDYDYAFHIKDSRIPGIGIFVDHTGFIGEMSRSSVTLHDDWVHYAPTVDVSLREALLLFVTDELLFAAAIQLERCLDMFAYSKNRIELIEYGKHQVELSKTVIAEAMKNNIPPITYARIVGEKLSLDWLEKSVEEVAKMGRR